MAIVPTVLLERDKVKTDIVNLVGDSGWPATRHNLPKYGR
jgi:hypothetical protein